MKYGFWSVRHPPRLVTEIHPLVLYVQSYEPEERYRYVRMYYSTEFVGHPRLFSLQICASRRCSLRTPTTSHKYHRHHERSTCYILLAHCRHDVPAGKPSIRSWCLTITPFDRPIHCWRLAVTMVVLAFHLALRSSQTIDYTTLSTVRVEIFSSLPSARFLFPFLDDCLTSRLDFFPIFMNYSTSTELLAL